MTENKKHTTKSNTESSPVNVEISAIEAAVSNQYVLQDFRNSILIVSVLVNMVILIVWIAMQVTSMYDAQVVGLLFNR